MIDRTKLFAGLRAAPFVSGMKQGQVDGINVILDCWEATYRVLDPRFIACSLATTYWEADKTMQPIEEYGHGHGHSYGTATGPWHVIYDGRGDVQLTWEANYAHATKRLRELGVIDASIDLERNPELALRPDIAAKILVVGMVEGWFTGKKLGDYFNTMTNDPIGSRRIINGTDHAFEISTIYGQFLAAVNSAWVAGQAPVPAPIPANAPTAPIAPKAPTPAQKPVPVPAPQPVQPMGLLKAIIMLLEYIFKPKVKP